ARRPLRAARELRQPDLGAGHVHDVVERVPRSPMRVLVSDGDERASLAVVRSLGRRDEVHVVGPGRASLAGSSRFAAAHHRLQAPAEDAAAYAKAVAALCATQRIDLVIPTTDAACSALIPARASLAPAVLAAPAQAPYERASDKGEVTRLAPRFGL